MIAASRHKPCPFVLQSLALAAIGLCLSNRVAAEPSAQRPLNPGPGLSQTNSPADQLFRIAFNAASSGDFNTAIINYQRAGVAVPSDCEKAHASAGQQAAMEAKGILKTTGWSGRPTQIFWLRLQELTKSLPCVTVR
jgi:hypothetical protein